MQKIEKLLYFPTFWHLIWYKVYQSSMKSNLPQYKCISTKLFESQSIDLKKIFDFWASFFAQKWPITADNIRQFGRLSVSADINFCLIGRSLSSLFAAGAQKTTCHEHEAQVQDEACS